MFPHEILGQFFSTFTICSCHELKKNGRNQERTCGDSLNLLQVAASAIDSTLMKYSAKEYFFKAMLCHMCVDVLNAQVHKYNFKGASVV